MPKNADQRARYTLKQIERNLYGMNCHQVQKYDDETWEMVLHPHGAGPADRVVLDTVPGQEVVYWRTEGSRRMNGTEDFAVATTQVFTAELLEVGHVLATTWQRNVAKAQAARKAARKAAGEPEPADTDEIEEVAA